MLTFRRDVHRHVGTAVAPLGNVIAVGTITHFDNLPAEQSTGYLTLFQSSGVDDGAYYPAQDLRIHGRENLTALRDLCNDLLNSQHPKINLEKQ